MWKLARNDSFLLLNYRAFKISWINSQVRLVDALFSGAVILTLDSMGRRAKLRTTDTKAMWINGLLLVLAVQGFDHMFL